MGKFKLTNAGRALIAIIVIAIIGGAISFAVKSGLINFKNDVKQPGQNVTEDIKIENISNTTSDDDTIHLSLDEWAG